MSGVELWIALAILFAAGFLSGYGIRDTRRWRHERAHARMLRHAKAVDYSRGRS